jgi:predicted amidophosphoribosyltransferase
MRESKKGSISVVCPCCNAGLTVDVELKKVIAHEAAPAKHKDVPDLNRVDVLLREQAARREAIFQQSTEDEKTKTQLLERKFAEALKKSKDQPVEKPTRDIDLD